MTPAPSTIWHQWWVPHHAFVLLLTTIEVGSHEHQRSVWWLWFPPRGWAQIYPSHWGDPHDWAQCQEGEVGLSSPLNCLPFVSTPLTRLLWQWQGKVLPPNMGGVIGHHPQQLANFPLPERGIQPQSHQQGYPLELVLAFSMYAPSSWLFTDILSSAIATCSQGHALWWRKRLENPPEESALLTYITYMRWHPKALHMSWCW